MRLFESAGVKCVNTSKVATVCGGTVNLGADTVEGELIPCGECGTELEVKGVNPFVLAEAPKEEEDWGE